MIDALLLLCAMSYWPVCSPPNENYPCRFLYTAEPLRLTVAGDTGDGYRHARDVPVRAVSRHWYACCDDLTGLRLAAALRLRSGWPQQHALHEPADPGPCQPAAHGL